MAFEYFIGIFVVPVKLNIAQVLAISTHTNAHFLAEQCPVSMADLKIIWWASWWTISYPKQNANYFYVVLNHSQRQLCLQGQQTISVMNYSLQFIGYFVLTTHKEYPGMRQHQVNWSKQARGFIRQHGLQVYGTQHNWVNTHSRPPVYSGGCPKLHQVMT